MVERGKRVLFGPLPPPYGGVSVFMSRLAARAIDRGVEIWSYGTDGGTDTVNTHFVNHRRLEHIRRLFHAGRGARIVDSTHFHFEYPHPLLLSLWLSLKLLFGFRWVKIVHDGSLPARHEEFGPVRRALFRAALRGVDELVTANSALEAWFKDVGGYSGPAKTIPTLLPPVSEGGRVSKMAPMPTKFLNYRFRICSLGVFIPDYGFDEVAEAVERLRGAYGDDIGLLLIDAGFAEDSSYRERVLMGRGWIEVARALPHAQLPTVLSMNDIFVRPFKYESFGLSRIEALWAGLPVVATDVGETRGMLVYKPGDIESLYCEIESVRSGRAALDTETAAQMFREEAEENLLAYLHLLTDANVD